MVRKGTATMHYALAFAAIIGTAAAAASTTKKTRHRWL
jgi:hypothetical protein